MRERFVAAGAVSPGRAIPALPAGDLERRHAQELEAFGAIVRLPDGRRYLDCARLAEHDRRRRRRALGIVGTALAAVAATAALLR